MTTASEHRQQLFGGYRTPECDELIAQRPERDPLDELPDAQRLSGATLDEDDVRTICKLWYDRGSPGARGRARAGRLTQTLLAERYGVAVSTVSKIVRGQTWGHLHIPCRDE